MNINRWLISVIVACMGCLISFIFSFRVNHFDTSLKRAFLSFIICFAVYELFRLILHYALDGHSVRELISKREEDHLEVEGEALEDLSTGKKDAAVEEENNLADSEQVQTAHVSADGKKDPISLQNEADYANVAQFVKSELIKSESENI